MKRLAVSAFGLVLALFSIYFVPSEVQASTQQQLDSQIRETMTGNRVQQNVVLSENKDLSPYWREYDIVDVGTSWIRGKTDFLEISYTVAGVITGDDYIANSYGLIYLDTDLDGVSDYFVIMDDDTAFGNISAVYSRILRLPISAESTIACAAKTRTVNYDTAIVSIPLKDCLPFRDTIGVMVSLGFGYGFGISDSSGMRYFSTPYRDIGSEFVGAKIDFETKALALAGSFNHKVTAILTDSSGKPIPNALIYLDSSSGRSHQNLYKTDKNGRVNAFFSIPNIEGPAEVYGRFGGVKHVKPLTIRRLDIQVWGDQNFNNRVSCLSNDLDPVTASDFGITSLRWIITRSLNGKVMSDTYDWPLGLPKNGETRIEEDVFGVRYSIQSEGRIVHGIWMKGQVAGEKIQCSVFPQVQGGGGPYGSFTATAAHTVIDEESGSVHDLVMNKVVDLVGYSRGQVQANSRQVNAAIKEFKAVYKPSLVYCVAYFQRGASKAAQAVATSRAKNTCSQLSKLTGVYFTSEARSSRSSSLLSRVAVTIRGVGQG